MRWYCYRCDYYFALLGDAMVNVRQAIDCVNADTWAGDSRVNFHTAIKAGRILARHIEEIDAKVYQAEKLTERHAALVEAARAVVDDGGANRDLIEVLRKEIENEQ